jgi:hypothetical protein
MSESNDEFNEKMSIVAEYDVKKVVWNRERGYGVQMSHGSFIPVSMLGYSTDWNKLNPVWAKVSKQVNPILTNFHADYHHAIDTNDIDFAFSVVVNAITLTTKP